MASPVFRPDNAPRSGHAGTNNNNPAGNRYIAEAIRSYARKVEHGNISACCGNAERVVRALAGERKLPGEFALPKQVRQSVYTMNEETRFALLAGLADAQNGAPKSTIYPIVIASSVGDRLMLSRPGEIIYGRTVEDWVQAARRLLEGVAASVEHFYGRQK